jgi:hypothetical protein
MLVNQLIVINQLNNLAGGKAKRGGMYPAYNGAVVSFLQESPACIRLSVSVSIRHDCLQLLRTLLSVLNKIFSDLL